MSANTDYIKSLAMENFTTFSKATLDFTDLNVITGESGTGKTHLLKLLYAALFACQRPGGRAVTVENHNGAPIDRPTTKALESALSEKLAGVFNLKYTSMGRLMRRQQGRNKCSVNITTHDTRNSVGFGFSARSGKVNVSTRPEAWHDATPVFLSAHEPLTIPVGFLWLFENYDTEFDETWYDTRKLFGAPTMQGGQRMDESLSRPLKEVLGGKVVYDRNDERFYLRRKDGMLEMSLVAEGLRKVGTLWYLMTEGHLANTSCLFWDEPVSNPNPRIMRAMAEAISAVSRSKTQVFVATHNLSFMREFERIQRGHDRRYLRYFVLTGRDGGIGVRQADGIHDIEPLVGVQQDSNHHQSSGF